ncbi:MAG: hypothetical protein ACKPHU_25095, partial [Planctomycetaceae bacterium]
MWYLSDAVARILRLILRDAASIWHSSESEVYSVVGGVARRCCAPRAVAPRDGSDDLAGVLLIFVSR